MDETLAKEVALVEPGVRVEATGPPKEDCPFCDIVGSRMGWKRRSSGVVIGRSAATFPDNYPVAPDHMLVVPRRHITSVLQLDRDETSDLWSMVNLVVDQLKVKGITDMNIGTNVGALAGQTIEHAHVHVIPRREGDVKDPRGGVRWVIPEKARYWTMHNYPA